MPHPLVMIEWEDSSQALPHWQWLSELDTPKVARCVSVGFLVKDDVREKALAISMANGEQVSGVISIPTRCVKRISRLTCRASACRGAASRRKRKRT